MTVQHVPVVGFKDAKHTKNLTLDIYFFLIYTSSIVAQQSYSTNSQNISGRDIFFVHTKLYRRTMTES